MSKATYLVYREMLDGTLTTGDEFPTLFEAQAGAWRAHQQATATQDVSAVVIEENGREFVRYLVEA
jgi:hypothetical protein